MPNWQKCCDALISRLAPKAGQKAYRNSDAEMIRRTTRGQGPDSGKAKPEAGVRVVYNIPAVHVPAFVAAGALSEKNPPFKNRYDLGKGGNQAVRLGQPPPAGIDVREWVDAAVATLAGKRNGSSLYYGAAELNGAGMRYYGDICLVLKPTEIDGDTLVLFRNSFDLARAPIADRIRSKSPDRWAPSTIKEARELEGRWEPDLASMAVCKALDGGRWGERRITTAAISDGLLNDEDYLEVVRTSSFGWNELEEARVAAADAGSEGRIADRIKQGPTPTQTELLWRHHRRYADDALTQKGVRTRIVVTAGRARV
jgi:hypothetical protein